MRFLSSHKKCLPLLLLLPLLLSVLITLIFQAFPFSTLETERYRTRLLEDMEQADTFAEFTQALFCYEVTSDSITTAYTLKNPEKMDIPRLTPTLTSFSYETYLRENQLDNATQNTSNGNHNTHTDDKNVNTTSQFITNCLSRFSSDELTEEEQLTYSLLQKYTETTSALAQFPFYENLLGSSSGVQANLPVTLGEYPLCSEDDIEIYLQLIKQIPHYFKDVIEYQKHRSQSGITTPAFLIEATFDSTQTMLTGFQNGDNSFIDTFHERIAPISGLSDKEKEKYIQQNQEYVEKYVVPAYEMLLEYLEETLSLSQNSGTGTTAHNENTSHSLVEPDTSYGLATLPNGKDYYTLLARHATGSSKSVSELIAMTEQSLQNALGTVLNTALTDQDAYLYYCEHPLESYYQSPEAILEALSLMMRKNYPLLSDTPSYRIKTVPDSLATSLSPAFYMIPAIDDYQNNTIYINPLYTNAENGNLFTTLAHEGFPGHLYQTVYFNESNPAPIRQLFNYLGYVEGWATYVEMDAFTFLEYPMEGDALCKLYQADSVINLALCSRIDMGVNYEGWTLNDTRAFFEENGFKDYYAEDVYTYVVEAPSNYLSYFIGYLEILELKDAYQRQKMENYSEKEFHKKLLDIGPADYETIRKYLLQ